jgi:hypothetical protein
MLILKATAGDVAGETRLAAAMLNFEHGARAYDAALRPGSGEPWPTVEIPPVTALGVAARAHYRPTVGVVYYTPHPDLNVGALLRRLRAAVDAQPADHLAAARAVAATASLTIRQARPSLVPGTAVVPGTHKSFRKRSATWATRIVMSAPADDLPPHHYSVRAGFTWVFTPICAALAVARSKNVAAVANAIIASVAYDVADMLRFDDGAEIYRAVGDADFTFGERPATIVSPAWAAQFGAGGDAALLVDPRSGTIEHVGRAAYLAAAPRALPREAAAETAPTQCCNCSAPICGDAVRLRRVPPSSGHGPATKPGAPLDLTLCRYCWNALEAGCVEGHIGVGEFRAVRVAGRGDLAPLLRARAAPVPGIPGAFAVTPAGENAPALVIAGENWGPFPYATVPGLAALRLPVVGGLRIAELN